MCNRAHFGELCPWCKDNDVFKIFGGMDGFAVSPDGPGTGNEHGDWADNEVSDVQSI
jgi:hypothetical protein